MKMVKTCFRDKNCFRGNISGRMAHMAERLLSIAVYTCYAGCHGFDSRCFPHIEIVWIFNLACLIKKPNGSLSRMCVQAYLRVK